MSRPVWLLDVDGVLNASRAGWSRAPRSAYARAAGREFKMRWEPALIARIHLLHASGQVEILWATSWADHVAEVELVMGLPSLPVAFSGLGDNPGAIARDRKRQAALDLVEAGRRLIWTDDDAFLAWHPAEFLIGAGHLLIAPTPSRGLRPEDMDRIEAYAVRQPVP